MKELLHRFVEMLIDKLIRISFQLDPPNDEMLEEGRQSVFSIIRTALLVREHPCPDCNGKGNKPLATPGGKTEYITCVTCKGSRIDQDYLKGE